MSFKDRYTTEAAQSSSAQMQVGEGITPESEKVVVSNDFFLLAEVIEKLTEEIEKLRLK